MSKYIDDTIAAVATPVGSGGVAIIRISGAESLEVFRRVFMPANGFAKIVPRHMYYGNILKNDTSVDEGLGVYFKSPQSYTGEDCVELHCHGGWAATRQVLEGVLACGARMALPGEFTKRAFLNGRLDLSMAEAVADMVSATTVNAAKVAHTQLSGRLRNSVEYAMDSLLNAVASIEVTVDYPEDDVENAAAKYASKTIEIQLQQLDELLSTANAGKVYREGVRCAIVGRPNVGKSSLLNALLGEDRAIVTDIAGTTRDTLEVELDIAGLKVLAIDTAGLRESDDVVERIGVSRAKKAIDMADFVIFLLDSTEDITPEDEDIYNSLKGNSNIILLNKVDAQQKLDIEFIMKRFGTDNVIEISALTGEGLNRLEHKIVEIVAHGDVAPKDVVMSNVRHIDAVRRARNYLVTAKETLASGMPPDMAVMDIREAWRALGEVTGGCVDEDVVDRIFAKFCVGK